MNLCYIDESGTSSIPGNTSHFVLAGLSIPIKYWKTCENEINAIKTRYSLESTEIHTGWIVRKYLEQSKVANFEKLDYAQRRYEVEKYRNGELLRLQKASNPKLYRQTKKNYAKTKDYIHLSYDQRIAFIEEIVKAVGNWTFARLFAECIDKIHYNPSRTVRSVDEQAFEQVVSRFEQYLRNTNASSTEKNYALLIHDNNETVAKKHTELMKSFHDSGTFWTQIDNIIETPLFVNSQLTSMVQIADVCAFSLRRYLENNDEHLFKHVFKRADRVARGGIVVGIRHFTNSACSCKICTAHRISQAPGLSSP